MIKRICAILLLTALLPAGLRAASKNTDSELADGFRTPPDSIQTSVYWYWISGIVSEEGVVKDLEAMKRAGINRAFIGNIGLGEPQTPYRAVKLFTDEWWRIVHAALRKAAELNIEIGIFNCPGWSQAGGPWIGPERSMRYLTSVTKRVTGGGTTDMPLEKPAADFQDVRVLAYPAPSCGRTSLTAADTRCTSSLSQEEAERLLDGNPRSGAGLIDEGETTFDFTADADFTLRSVTLWPLPAPIRAEAELLVKEPTGWRSITAFSIDRTNPSIEVGFDAYAPVSISVAATTGRSFRLKVRTSTRGSGLGEVRFSSLPGVEHYAEKTFAKMYQSPLPYWKEYQWREQPEADDTSLAVAPEQVLDITECLHGDRLEWEAPAGEWIVQRTGMRPTGMSNGPAAAEGTGLEVDKMTSDYLPYHFDAFLGEVLRRIPAEDRRTFRIVVADSYEKGGQNFTDTFMEDFRRQYGYDPLPYLPAYEGTVVGSRNLSDRFLWDMRRLVADKLSYEHIGGLRKIAHRHGLTLWLENYGHWGFPGEFLQYGGQSDEVSGEFWSEGTLGDIENRAASSCAHIYGKRKVSAESFTAGGNHYLRHPRLMKQRGDRFFSEGINNTLLHVFISQPGELVPGMNADFGNEFNRHNTWFSQLDLFTSYLKRTNFMLQQGLNVADAAYFIGEDAPKMTGVTDPELPKGYQFDYINGEVLLKHMTVRDGLWTLPHGTQYRILVLPRLATMRPELLARLQELVREGGILLGPAPRRSPSLEGYPSADETVRRIAAELWGRTDGIDSRSARYGKGAVLNGLTMEEALAYAQCPPDCKTPDNTPVLYGHRDGGDRQIYYLTNQSEERIEFPCTFRVTGMHPELWDPVNGEIRPLPEYSDNGRTTRVPIVLDPIQSLFVVFNSKKAPGKKVAGTANFPEPVSVTTLDGPWTLTFEQDRRGPAKAVTLAKPEDLSLSEDPSIRYFSGTVHYRTSFRLGRKQPGRLLLNTGEVGVMARIYVNGHYAGGVWTAPYKVDITRWVRAGENSLTIDVVNTWANRLIGDSMLPPEERGTWTLHNPFRPDSRLQPSGLLHPVTLERIPH